jgi:hypothetical protein
MNAISWLTAWIVAIVLLVALASTSWGKGIVYYFLWLAVVLLLVTHGNEVQSVLSPITGGTQTGGSQTNTTASTI